MEKEFFRVPQKAMIKKSEKYLIIKRAPNAHTYPNHWDFPRGRLEAGENPKEGLRREVFEETKLKIKTNKPVFTFHETLNNIPTFFIVYDCKIVSGKIKLSHEHTEYKWATKKEILNLETENFLRAFLKGEN